MNIRSIHSVVAIALWLVSPAFGAGVFSPYVADDSADPQTPGWHKLVYHYSADGADRAMSFALYLPEGYDAKKSWPMVVFLCGIGERGTDPQVIFTCGVARELAEHPEVQKWAPFIVLMPQCTSDVRWESRAISKAAADLTREVAKHWPVEASRIYLTGLSMGGSGCWSVAQQAPKQFAVVAPIVANQFEPENIAGALRETGTTCLVISGASDIKSEPGSGTMVAALRRANVDVVYVKVPYGDHCLWPWYYGNKAFYEWLLLHKQGQKPPSDRASAESLMAMATPMMQRAAAEMQHVDEQLQQVAKWWHVDNCNLNRRPGLRGKLLSRPNVFATSPFTCDVPCRIQTTTTLPSAKSVMLHLVVGHHPQGSWQLTVRVNEQEVFTTSVDKTKSDHWWLTQDIDLSKFAGQEVRLQLVNANNGDQRDDAYWHTIEIVAK